MYTPGPKTFIAGEALEDRRLVKIKSGTVIDPPEVVYADAGDVPIGVTEAIAAIGTPVAIRMLNDGGTFEIECLVDSAIARGALLYTANDGMVSDAAVGSVNFQAMEVGADNAHIEVAVNPVLPTTAVGTSLADAGGFTSETTVEGAIAEIYQNTVTAQATIPIPLGAINMEDGTVLTKQATTVAGIAQLANKEQVIMIPVDCSAGESLGFSVAMPQDLDESADVTVHVLAGKAADNDALTLDCEVYPVGAGDVANADIQDTAAQAIVAAVTELIFTCGADGLIAAPSGLSVVLALGGTNDGDATYIYAVWLEYTRKILTA